MKRGADRPANSLDQGVVRRHCRGERESGGGGICVSDIVREHIRAVRRKGGAERPANGFNRGAVRRCFKGSG